MLAPAENSLRTQIGDARLSSLWRLFTIAVGLIVLRLVWLEASQGDAFRHAAVEGVERRSPLPCRRGRILSGDGTVLAADENVFALSLPYRQFVEPADAVWLRAEAKSRLAGSQRRHLPAILEQERLVADARRSLFDRLAEVCGLAPADLRRCADRVQRQVEHVAASVNARRRARGEAPVTVAEELDSHVIVDDLPVDAVEELERRRDEFPGLRIEGLEKRRYPRGSLAAHAVGYLGQSPALVGVAGLERQYESRLAGTPGVLVVRVRRDGTVLSRRREREPVDGRDVTLALDAALQLAAERLLDDACQRRDALAIEGAVAPSGGAALILDVADGAVLAAASSPRFDPNDFASAALAASSPSREKIAAMLADPAHPLFDRACQMALPPGSVFKPVVAAALLEEGVLTPRTTLPCQGFFENAEQFRCAAFTRSGAAHGEVDLRMALSQSCNVYFFRGAAKLGWSPLLTWVAQLGFGSVTGIDLPAESAGRIPPPVEAAPEETLRLAVGQGGLTATPLQIAQLYSALASGRMVVPRFAKGPAAPSSRRMDLQAKTLAAIREGLSAAVQDADGTGRQTVHLEDYPIAGKTGTAQAGGGLADHAWFAAYLPADEPKYVIVVALEHAGDGALAAGPVVRRLAERLRDRP